MLEIIDSYDVAKQFAIKWNQIAESRSGHLDGTGPTALYDLTMLTKVVHAPDSELCIYASADEGNIKAFLPCYKVARRIGPVTYGQASLIADLYPGRTGPLYMANDLEALERLFVDLFSEPKLPDVLQISFVEHSSSESIFLRLAREFGVKNRLVAKSVCPYIRLPEAYNELAATFSKKFRYNLRSREKKIRSSGEIRIGCFNTCEKVPKFLRGVKSIERKSWKETAGTSLTKNAPQQEYHERMVPISAQLGILRSYIMFLDDEAIAHIIGLYAQGIFYCLKSSFVDRYREYSPGVLLKSQVLHELIEDRARYWDFVGPAENHKMQWTKDSYTVNKYAVYSKRLRSRLLSIRADLGQWYRARRD